MTRTTRLVLALLINLALAAGLAIGGIAAHSIALVADAAHDLTDVAALLLALGAVRLALRRPTAARSFGYHRATILASLGNVALLLVATALISAGAVFRLLHPATVSGGLVLAFAGSAAVVNAVAALFVREHSRDLNMAASALHLAADAAASLGVALAGLIELLTHGSSFLDPVASLLLGALIAVEAVRVGRASVDVLLESAPDDLDLSELSGAIAAVSGVDGVHDLHCWSLSSEVRALSAHVLLDGHPSLEDARTVGEAVKVAISGRFEIAHTTLELECEPCSEGGQAICTIDASTFV